MLCQRALRRQSIFYSGEDADFVDVIVFFKFNRHGRIRALRLSTVGAIINRPTWIHENLTGEYYV